MPDARPRPPDQGAVATDTPGPQPADNEPTGDRPAARRRPNYFVRRAIFVGSVVAIVVATGTAVGWILDDGSEPRADTSVEWNRAVVITDDTVRTFDPRGESEPVEFTIGTDLLDTEPYAIDDTLVLLADSGRLVLVDLDEGDTRRTTAPADGVLVTDSGNPRVLAAGEPEGGDLVIVDTTRRSTVDVARLADLDDPLMFAQELVANSTATHAAVSDGRSFQTVLVSLTDGTVDLLAGRAAAINDTTLVTAQRAGERTGLDFFELTGERIGIVDLPTPEAMMLTGERSAVTVAGDGRIFTISSNGTVDEVGSLVDDGRTRVEVRRGEPVADGERLLVEAEGLVALVDSGGTVRAVVDGDLVGAVDRTTRCALVALDDGSGYVQLDLLTAEVLGNTPVAAVAATSLDGCTASFVGGTRPDVLVDGDLATVPIDGASVTGVAPDGAALVVSRMGSDSLVATADVTVGGGGGDGGHEESTDGDGDDRRDDDAVEENIADATVELVQEPALVRFAEVPS